MPQQPSACPKCGSVNIHGLLVSGTVVYDCMDCTHRFSQSIFGIDAKVDRALEQAKRKAWGFQFWWFGYLFRRPGLVFLIFAWAVSLIFFFSIRPGTSFLQSLTAWFAGTALIAATSSLTVLYRRQRRSGLGMSGWKAAFQGDPRVFYGIAAAAAVAVLIDLLAHSGSSGRP